MLHFVCARKTLVDILLLQPCVWLISKTIPVLAITSFVTLDVLCQCTVLQHHLIFCTRWTRCTNRSSMFTWKRHAKFAGYTYITIVLGNICFPHSIERVCPGGQESQFSHNVDPFSCFTKNWVSELQLFPGLKGKTIQIRMQHKNVTAILNWKSRAN